MPMWSYNDGAKSTFSLTNTVQREVSKGLRKLYWPNCRKTPNRIISFLKYAKPKVNTIELTRNPSYHIWIQKKIKKIYLYGLIIYLISSFFPPICEED